MEAFAGFEKEIFCMDFAYLDVLAKDSNGLKYLLFRQDLFDRTVDAKMKENKSFQGNGSCVFYYDYKK